MGWYCFGCVSVSGNKQTIILCNVRGLVVYSINLYILNYLFATVAIPKDDCGNFLNQAQLLPPLVHQHCTNHTHRRDLIIHVFLQGRSSHRCNEVENIRCPLLHFDHDIGPLEFFQAFSRCVFQHGRFATGPYTQRFTLCMNVL